MNVLELVILLDEHGLVDVSQSEIEKELYLEIPFVGYIEKTLDNRQYRIVLDGDLYAEILFDKIRVKTTPIEDVIIFLNNKDEVVGQVCV